MNRAVFLDRDGTVIEECGYLRDPELVRLLPGAAEALEALSSEGWKLIVVSNQSGVGRGLITPDEMHDVEQRFLELLASRGVQIHAVYVCAHTPDDLCQCRKPAPFLLHKAAAEHALDLSSSWMIGDREGDILCGRSAGCSTVWLRNDIFPVAADLPTFATDDWREIEARIRQRPAQRLARR